MNKIMKINKSMNKNTIIKKTKKRNNLKINKQKKKQRKRTMKLKDIAHHPCLQD